MSSLKEKAINDSDNVNKNKKEVVDVCSIIENVILMKYLNT